MLLNEALIKALSKPNTFTLVYERLGARWMLVALRDSSTGKLTLMKQIKLPLGTSTRAAQSLAKRAGRAMARSAGGSLRDVVEVST